MALAPKDRSADYLLSILRAPFGRYRGSAAGGVTGGELHWLSEVAASWAELGREVGPRLIGRLRRLMPWLEPSVIFRTPRSLIRHALPRGLRDIPSCC